MKKFKYIFKPFYYVLIGVALLVALATIVLTIFRFFKFGFDPSKSLGLIVTLIIVVLILVLLISMLINSCYIVNDKNFVLRWGILKNEIPIKEITRVIYNPDSDKLTIYFGPQDNFMVINIGKVNPMDLVDALLEKNKRISVEFIGNEQKEKEDKSNKDKK